MSRDFTRVARKRLERTRLRHQITQRSSVSLCARFTLAAFSGFQPVPRWRAWSAVPEFPRWTNGHRLKRHGVSSLGLSQVRACSAPMEREGRGLVTRPRAERGRGGPSGPPLVCRTGLSGRRDSVPASCRGPRSCRRRPARCGRHRRRPNRGRSRSGRCSGRR